MAVLAIEALQGGQLDLQTGLVLGQRLLEQLALLGVHRFGLGAEAPGLQARQLEGDALDPGVLELDVAGLALDVAHLTLNVPTLRADVGQHLAGHFGQCARTQTLEVMGLEGLHIEHVLIVRSQPAPRIGATSNCLVRLRCLVSRGMFTLRIH